MTSTLEDGDSGLVIVAVNPNGSDITPMLAYAEKVVVDATTKGDLEDAYDDAVRRRAPEMAYCARAGARLRPPATPAARARARARALPAGRCRRRAHLRHTTA